MVTGKRLAFEFENLNFCPLQGHKKMVMRPVSTEIESISKVLSFADFCQKTLALSLQPI